MTETKCVVITGGAEKSSRRPRSKTRKAKESESSESSEPSQPSQVKRVTLHRGGFQVQPAELKATAPGTALGTAPVVVQARTNATPLQSTGSLPAPALTSAYVTLPGQGSPQVGGVVLKPKKPKVILQPHKKKESKNTTRKVRRVIINTKQMVHGMTRVKDAHKDASSMSIDTIKKFLIDRGIIQPTSKAPASMLRSMYADCNIIRDGKAL
jgi:hypothetical protein